MNKIPQRTLMAYRPLYLNGLLLDGVPVAGAARTWRALRLARAAGRLTGLGRHLYSHRSKSC